MPFTHNKLTLPIAALCSLTSAQAQVPVDPSPPRAIEHGSPPGFAAAVNAGTFSSVNLANGNLHTSVSMIAHVPGLGPPIVVSLGNSSANAAVASWPEFPLGSGWGINALSVLELTGSDSAQLTTGDGTRIFFESGVSSAGYRLTLVQVGATQWEVRSLYGSARVYDFSVHPTRGRISSIRDAAGWTLSYTYNGVGRLVSMSDAGGRSVSFPDDDLDGLADRVVDDSAPLQQVFHLAYQSGRLSSVTDVKGTPIEFTYEASGRIKTIRDGYDDDANNSRNLWQYQYDAVGRTWIVSDPAPHTTQQVFTYATTSSGSKTTVIARTGTTWTFDFDTFGRRVAETDPLSHTSHFAYGADDQLTQFTDAESQTWTFSYDAAGNWIGAIDPEGWTKTKVYDSASRLIACGTSAGPVFGLRYEDPDHPRAFTAFDLPPDGMGHGVSSVLFDWEPAGSTLAGQLKEIVDFNGTLTRFGYDARGLLQTTEEGFGFARPVRTQLTYDATGARVMSAALTAATGASDPAGFPALPAPHPAIVAPASRTDSTVGDWIDDAALVSSTVTSGVFPVGSAGPELTAQTTREFTYDFLGRMVTASRADNQGTLDLGLPTVLRSNTYDYTDGSTAQFPYGGVVSTDPDGTVTTVVYDAAGRVASSSVGSMCQSYEYAADDVLLSTTESVGSKRVRTRYSHLDNDQPAGIRIDHSVDGGANWTTQRELVYVHDAGGKFIATLEYRAGVLVAGTQYTEDARGQLIWEKRVGVDPYNRFYTYDAGGNRKLKLVLDSSDQLISYVVYDYDVDNPALYGSKANRLMKEVSHAASGAVLETRWYFYDDKFGSVREVVRHTSGDTYFYGTQIHYQERAHPGFKYAPNLILERRWMADAALQVVPGSLTWLSAVELRQEGLVGRYAYLPRDPDTLAVLLVSAEGDEDPRVWTDCAPGEFAGGALADYSISPYDGSTTTLTTFVPGAGELGSSGEVWYAGDRAGNTRWWMTSDAGVFHDNVATAFGERVSSAGPFEMRFGGFSGLVGGEENLLPNGWVRIGARIYDPASGRWLQRDPIGIEGGFNVYEYVFNRPGLHCDPLGLQALPVQPMPNPVKVIIVYDDLTTDEVVINDPTVKPGETKTLPGGPPPCKCCGKSKSLPKDFGGCTCRPPDTNGPAPGSQPRETPGGHGKPHQPHPAPGGPGSGETEVPKPDTKPIPGDTRPNGNSRPPGGGVRPMPRPIKPRCFDGATLVSTPNGLRRIDELSRGDLVLAYEVASGRSVERRIEAVQRHSGPNLIADVKVGQEVLRVVPGHYFLGDDGWVAVGLGAVADGVMTTQGLAKFDVQSAAHVTDEPVFNLLIEHADTYLVGKSGVVVRDH